MNSTPVIAGCIGIALHHIASKIPARGLLVQRLTTTGCREFHEITAIGSRRAWLIVVGYEIALMRAIDTSLVLATIAGVLLAPVVVDVVHILHKDIAILRCTAGTIQSRAAIVVVSQQVVVIGGR